jgi:hypothetical protein
MYRTKVQNRKGEHVPSIRLYLINDHYMCSDVRYNRY